LKNGKNIAGIIPALRKEEEMPDRNIYKNDVIKT
jgi:hypothetical protein